MDASFTDLRREAMLERAAELLRRTGATVTAVGLEVAYSESGNFARAFRRWTGRWTGLSRRAYRRRCADEPRQARWPPGGPARPGSRTRGRPRRKPGDASARRAAAGRSSALSAGGGAPGSGPAPRPA